MGAMRNLLLQIGNSWEVCRLTDDGVIEQIADLLASKRVHVHRKAARIDAVDVKKSGSGSTVVLAAPFPLSDRSPRTASISSRSQVVDPPTFSPDIDVIAQSATLVAAAKSGAPVCLL